MSDERPCLNERIESLPAYTFWKRSAVFLLIVLSTGCSNPFSGGASTSASSGTTWITVTKTANYSLATSDSNTIFLVNTSATMTLPNPASVAVYYTVGFNNTGVGTVTVIPFSTETINGMASYALSPNQTMTLITDGTNWFFFNNFAPAGPPAGAGLFVLAQTPFNGCFGSQISTMTRVVTAATVTTKYNHYLTSGNTITVTGALPAGYNGTFSVTVTGAKTFTYTMLGDPGGSATTVGEYCYPTTGLAGGNAVCLSELTANTSWWGYTQAKTAGLLTAGHVTAFLCDGVTCNNPEASKNYYFANVNDSAAGGAKFTTDASGIGPNDANNWASGDRFGGTLTGSVFGSQATYTGRGAGSATAWPNTSAATTCTGWTVNTGTTGEVGAQSNVGNTRWAAGANGNCNAYEMLICLVNP